MLKMKKIAALLCSLALACSAAVLAGCSGQSLTGPSADSVVSYDEGLRVIGVKDISCSKRQIKNETGADITAISVQSFGSEYPQSAIAQGDEAWKDGDTVVLCYTISGQTFYNIKFTAGGKEYTLHDAHLNAITNALHDDDTLAPVSIKLDGGLAYLEWENNGETVSTLDHEKDLK